MSVYYNEIDKRACAWLRELMIEGLIPAGDVDDRSIEDVAPVDLVGYTQCHFFAGIGGWALALQMAAWPADEPVWTGSCPCQPFSTAGARKGFADERHLWPSWLHLIQQRRPVVIFGEQVAKKPGLAWLDVVQHELDIEGYRVGHAVLAAAGVGAPHIRERTYWVADSSSARLEEQRFELARFQLAASKRGGPTSFLGYAGGAGGGRHAGAVPGAQGGAQGCLRGEPDQSVAAGATRLVGDASGQRQQLDAQRDGSAEPGLEEQASRGADVDRPSFWDSCDWIPCRDGKFRPVEPGTFPLAHGVPGRVGLLRGYGNAIVPQLAAEFIKAYIEVR